MMTSALLAVSAVIVAPYALNACDAAVDVNGNGVVAVGPVAPAACVMRPCVFVAADVDDGVGSGASPDDGVDPPSLPVRSPRSVCATFAASAFFRYTMKRL